MTRYIALLRGINVGKNNRVPMAELRRILTDLGATEVTTLLQSGNAVFSCSLSEAKIGSQLEASLARDLAVTVRVVVRTAARLRKAIAGDPFGEIADDPTKHLLAFCSEPPTHDRIENLRQTIHARQAKGGKDSGDRWQIDGDHIYVWCPVNVHESIFATVKWDKVLGVQVTMRNFATVGKLLEMT